MNSITPTVFQTALHPDKEKGQWSPDLKSLTADALLFFAAGKPWGCLFLGLVTDSANLLGTDTTAHTLTVGTWYLLNNIDMLKTLREELVEVIPDVNSAVSVDWVTLEKLPYLVSFILLAADL
jgi:hypothetical protein